MKNVVRLWIISILGLALWLSLPNDILTVGAQNQACFPETGQCLEGRFYTFWERNGGLQVFGYPLTSAQNEPDEDGKSYLTQWLERERFEEHPAQAAPYDVQLGRLGVDRLMQLNQRWQDFPKANPATAHYFSETGQAIHPQFWEYWRTNGLEFGDSGTSMRESIARFGYPISPAREEIVEGKKVLTQWFERARFEYHPDLPPAYQVLLGRLGAEIRGAVDMPGVIAYAANILRTDGLVTLQLVQPSGLNAITLGTTALNSGLSWSANGQRIAFADREKITVVERNGRILTSFAGTMPTLSPDGTQIAFVDQNRNIVSGLVAGSGIAELTSSGIDRQPIWSPDGRRIAFETRRDGGEAEIYIMNTDGSQQTNLSRNTGPEATRDHSPVWSPDGRQLAYIAARIPGTPRGLSTAIVLVNADTSQMRRFDLERFAITEISSLRWSPDGSAVAFAATINGNQDIFVLDAAGNEFRPITSDAAPDAHPSWSPDSQALAFSSLRDGVQAVYIKRFDTGQISRLTEAGSGTPFWSPR
jgi:hypothetical protein